MTKLIYPTEDLYMAELPELKRCPFCGSRACSCAWPGAYATDEHEEIQPNFRVHCQSCACSIEHDDNANYFTDEKSAVDFWNKRVVDE